MRLTAGFLLALALGCGDNPLVEETPPFGAIVPSSADVAVGAKHDVATFAVGECRQTLDLTNLLVTTAFTTFFVANGRLDAALALPGALPDAITVGTECDPLDYEVEELVLEGDAFSLDAQEGTIATVLAESEGTTTLRASFLVSDGSRLAAESTFRAHVADRVEMSLACEQVPNAEYAGLLDAVAESWVPAASTITLGYQIHAGDVALAGYDYVPVEAGALEPLGEVEGGLSYETPAAAGPVHLTSSIDPSFALDLEVYDASAFDEVRVVRTDHASVWTSTPFFQVATFPVAGGQVPCIERVERTLTVETPDVCQFAGGGDLVTRTAAGRGSVDAFMPLSTGVCRLRADVVGGTATGTLEVVIGRPWEPVDTGNPLFEPWAIWGSGPDDVVIAGSVPGKGDALAAVLRGYGETWEVSLVGPSGRLYGVWGSGPDHVVAVGDAGAIVAWDGDAWTAETSGTTAQLYAVHGYGPTEVYVVGGDGTILLGDGDAWTPIDVGSDEDFVAAWGPSPGVLYLVGQTGAVYRLSDGALTAETLTPIGVQHDGPGIFAIWGTGPSDVWAAGRQLGFHYDGDAWTEVGAFFSTTGIWGSGPDDVVMVGGQSSLRWDGEAWIQIPLPGDAQLDRVWGTSADEVFAVDQSDGLFRLVP